MLVGSGIIPPTVATVSSISAAASLASSAARRSPIEIKEEQSENGRAGRDQEEQVDVVKTDQPTAPPPQSIGRKRKLVDLDANRLANEGKEAKAFDDSYSKRIKFDTLATNQSYDNQFLSTSSNRTNGQTSQYPASLCYS